MPRPAIVAIVAIALIAVTYVAQSEADNCRWTIIGYHCPAGGKLAEL